MKKLGVMIRRIVTEWGNAWIKDVIQTIELNITNLEFLVALDKGIQKGKIDGESLTKLTSSKLIKKLEELDLLTVEKEK